MLHKKYVEINGKKVPLIKGGKGGCFVAGTLIKTPTGTTPIEHLKIGDEVVCFDFNKNLYVRKITDTFIHYEHETLKITLWGNKEITITPNHWVLNEYNTFSPASSFGVESVLVDELGNLLPITAVEAGPVSTVYNLTVDEYHTYIANGIRVHNKGGSKAPPAPGVEDPNTLFSTDLLFLTIALGEGPVYRINPNGPQDVEINEGSIDDLINLDGDGAVNQEFFEYNYVTGTLTQTPLAVFGTEIIVPQQLSGAVTLKYGNIAGIPRSSVTLQDTSIARIDAIRFMFAIGGLQQMDDQGNIKGYHVGIECIIYDRTGLNQIAYGSRYIEGKTGTDTRFICEVQIPGASVSTSGYKFTVNKVTVDVDSAKVSDSIAFIAWEEITYEKHSYPRTAIIGYALKATSEYSGGVPTFTSMVKGLLVKVPSNYNQPILSNGEIDWRELETGSYRTNPSFGYRLQAGGIPVIYNDAAPQIYIGVWDGSFVYSWTQNPVWILYDMLTNTTYGLGIPEENIDKYKFYLVAQYCDACDFTNGTFVGVPGYADGTYRYKPRNYTSVIRQVLVGLPRGTSILERRFLCDISISGQKQVMDIITQVAALFRGVLFYSGGKITLNVDMPDEIPKGIFNEANIEKDSISISGIKESDILTAVEISYIEPSNHYRREVVRVDDQKALTELNQIENVKTFDLAGCTRRSQAIRFAQYLLASSKFIRRKISFKTTIEAIDLTVGDVIAVSQRTTGTSWGYGGRVSANSVIGQSNIYLEHFTSPAISASTFTSNTNPLGIRVIGQNSDRVDLYILSNSISTASTSNVSSGIDLITVQIAKRYKTSSKTYASETTFLANNVPVAGDLWTIGEIDTNDYYRSTVDKLFKITGIQRDSDEKITITASEYIANVYVDSESAISYVPVVYQDTMSPLVPPPTPQLDLRAVAIRNSDGTIRHDIVVSSSTDFTGYPLSVQTEFEYAAPTISEEIFGRIN